MRSTSVRWNTSLLLAVAFGTAGVRLHAQQVSESPRPNILYIMADDHAAHALGAYNGRLASLDPTPTLDRLAAEGMLFENCFVTNSICTPSRASILTGQYSHVNGVLDLGGRLPPDRQMLPIRMRQAGYQTAMIGKWHLKEEPNVDYYKVLPGQGKYMDPEFREKGVGQSWPANVVEMEGHSSDCVTDSTLAWLRRRDRDRPFFLMHHFKAPHDMFTYAPRYESYLAETAIPEPPSLWKQPRFGSIATRGHEDELLRYIGTSIGRRHAHRNYARKWAREGALSDDQAKRQSYLAYLRAYLRCVKGIDDNLARLFAYLKDEGLYDSTVIVYSSDQGMMLGEHDYQDKRWIYEESQRMPLIVRHPPSVPAGRRSDALVENVDFAPTLLGFAGVSAPEGVQGRSFQSICTTGREPDDWRTAVYYRYWMHMAHHWNPAHFGIRTKTHKLIFYYGCDTKGGRRTPPGWELYDLVRDPHETVNLYDDPAYGKTVRELKDQLRALRDANGDTDERFPEVKAVVSRFWDYGARAREEAVKVSHACRDREARGRKGRAQAAKVRPGGWIEAAPSKTPLRTHGGAAEISRSATYRYGPPGNPGFNPDNAYLLSGTAPPSKPHAFHSALDAERPFVVVRLDDEHEVSALRIVNRCRSHHDRAAGLTLWLSDDGETWQETWRAPVVAPEWLAELPAGTRARFLKLGLPGKGTLHLNQIVVFGR